MIKQLYQVLLRWTREYMFEPFFKGMTMLRKYLKAIGSQLNRSDRVVSLDKRMASFETPGTLETMMHPQRPKQSNIEQREVPSLPIFPDQIMVVVELPRGSIENSIREFRVSSKATAGELTTSLAKHYKVHKGAWKLYGSVNRKKYPTSVLDHNAPIKSYNIKNSPQARLYFYPEIRI